MKTLAFVLLAAIALAEDQAPTRIQWYATWTQAKSEAARLEKPILLISAAPQCRGISGVW